MPSFSYAAHRTKIVATIGPASSSPEVIRQLIEAGMTVARLNFSHGSYADHARTIQALRDVSEELSRPIALLQDLQGPKIRVGHLPDGALTLQTGDEVGLVPVGDGGSQPGMIPIDYPGLAEEAQVDYRILMDDGLLELRISRVEPPVVYCKVVRGGILKNRKGVNLPNLDLRLPSLTEKDLQDLDFGISQKVDWISLSFVRQAEDIRILKRLMAEKGANIPVVAKIEKPQAIQRLEEILTVCDGVMVARGDLGVEMNPEKVPLLQKQIIRECNRRGLPVITATQMLESMIHNPRPTRAEASDVANAILDGTDAVMLSGESAVGEFPVQAVQMLASIAIEVERVYQFPNLPPETADETHAISECLTTIDHILDLRCIAAFTTTGYTVKLAASERPHAPIVAFTADPLVCRRLNLIWGVLPMLLERTTHSVEELVVQIEEELLKHALAKPDDKVLIIGGSPLQCSGGTNFLKIHKIHA